MFDSRVCHLMVCRSWRENWQSLPFLKVLKRVVDSTGERFPLRKAKCQCLSLSLSHSSIIISIITIIWEKQRVLKHFFKLPSSSTFNPLTSGLEFVDNFFLFDPPVLEPDCNLSLREIRRG